MPVSRRSLLLFVFVALLTLSCSLFTPTAAPDAGAGDIPATTPAETTRPDQDVVEATRVVTEPVAATALVQAEVPEVALDLESLLIDLYEFANPSVVQILVYVAAAPATPLGSGSGFVYDEAGRIVTNNHVVEGGDVLEVVFSDGSRRRAEIVGRDPDSDLAVIAVDALPARVQPLPLGNSSALRVGQLAVAIGSPFGRAGSMTLGIVSALGRTLETPRLIDGRPGQYTLPQVIQTDAPINPGNSGGPLLNLQGEVIGVNSAIATATGIGSGVGFAVPVNAVRRIVPALVAEGSYTYPFVGIRYETELSLAQLEQLGMLERPGIYVIGITAGSPAEQAGIQPATGGRVGDVIIAIDDHEVRDSGDLISYLVFETVVGQTVQLTVVRNGETLTIPLTLAARP
jgi:2-alkenal reductase